MKAILEFSLPRERIEHQDAINGWKWKSVIWGLYWEILRPVWKHGDDEKNTEFAEGVWDRVHERMEELGITLDD